MPLDVHRLWSVWQQTLALVVLVVVLAGAVVGLVWIDQHLHLENIEKSSSNSSTPYSSALGADTTTSVITVGLLPLLNYAGADLWESFSPAGALNPLFGLMLGSPIGSLGMFKAGLKKLFPEQVKILDWSCMDVLGSRARFRKYKLQMSSPSAIDPNRDCESNTFRRISPKDGKTSTHWEASSANPEIVEGYDDHPLREHLHGDNDDLLHMSPHETVVTFESVDRFQAALVRNAFTSITLSVIAISGTIVPLVALYPMRKDLSSQNQYQQSQFFTGFGWAGLAFAYSCLSALTGYLALRITTSDEVEGRRPKFHPNGKKQTDTGPEVGDQTKKAAIIRAYWQEGKDQYRMGTYFTEDDPFVQHGLYDGILLLSLSILQGLCGILLAIFAGLCTLAVVNAEVTIFIASIPPGLKVKLGLWPLLISVLRIAFVTRISQSTKLCPKLDGQDILSKVVVEALEPEDKKATWTVDANFQKRFLKPLRLSWLEQHRIVFKTTQYGGYWHYFPTKFVLEPNVLPTRKSQGIRLILPSASIIDGDVLRILLIQLQRKNEKVKYRSPSLKSIRSTSIIRDDATYFLTFTWNAKENKYNDAKAILIPSQPWSSEFNARSTLFAPSWAAASAPVDDPKATEKTKKLHGNDSESVQRERKICLQAQLPTKMVGKMPEAGACSTCLATEKEESGSEAHGDTRTTLYRPESSLPKGLKWKRGPGQATVRIIHGQIPFDGQSRVRFCLSRQMTVGNEGCRILRKVDLPQSDTKPLTLWIYDESQHQDSKDMLAGIEKAAKEEMNPAQKEMIGAQEAAKAAERVGDGTARTAGNATINGRETSAGEMAGKTAGNATINGTETSAGEMAGKTAGKNAQGVHQWMGDDLLIIEPGQEYAKDTVWRKLWRHVVAAGTVFRWYTS